MASEVLFQQLAPFPADIPVAPLYTFRLVDLGSGDQAVAKDLVAACQELGFFQLDLRADEIGDAAIGEIDQLFGVGKDLLDLPPETKAKFLHDAPRSFLGFKPRGQAKIETGEPDRFEWFNVGQDGLKGNTAPQPLPPLMHDNLPLLTSFLDHGQSIVNTISRSLATQLGLPADAISSLQQPDKLSGTVIRFIKAFASPDNQRTNMIHHTDFGTITLLANLLGGLQILAPQGHPEDKSAWLWVRPQPGCLIVNLGDAMVQWTGGLLRSNVHRISVAPGEQRLFDRYSLALLVRPERDASMRKLTGSAKDSKDGDDDNGDLTAWQWEVKKAMALTRDAAMVQSKGGNPTPLKS
ncbi:hypothetical protein PFICI_14204 [Pestalotiopsis fici W106-1]|uniref:Fe2OG dioxygenase domain-containing protein n=1 Tax=Pestalotiopsis fici (strain W106-1 / CGMCC3.15140) TaxID=1229662 RepID=W3WKE7_PESFW|nr:uncharacterized protein PFICI_14204 [Pestalotiopsis fici W106-1]ETS74338.1 hypothetical protein PFICI_14204 [Pestalotiopsis fici W106-1]